MEVADISMAKLLSKKIINNEDVFDLSTKKNHNFYANNVLVHNCTKWSQQGSNLLKLDAEYKVGMTGTILVNSPISAYLALSWIDADHATLTNFKSQYCKFGGFNDSQVIGYKNLDLLKDELESCSLRRTFDQVRGDMPDKNIEYELVEMSDEHRRFYEAIKNGVKEEADKVELKTNNLLALTTRLRQATACPSVLTTDPPSSSKIDRAVEIAEDILEQGDKVVIFSTFVEPCKELARRLTKYKPLLGTGNQNEEVTSKNIDLFRNSEDFNLLIGTTSKIGTGFSIPECRYEIIIDQPWTHALFSQVIDRCYRITSQQPIFVKVLVCKDTIDERVQQIVEAKKDLSDYVIDDIENESFSNTLRDIISNL